MADLTLLGADSHALAARTCAIIARDKARMRCLEAVKTLALPDWFIAAGFVRNAIWDDVHGYQQPTKLNDVDVVFFDPNVSQRTEERVQRELRRAVPGTAWEVKNQARMHKKHGHAPYQSSADAISRWIEVPTCVGVTLSERNELQVLAPFGLGHNFSLRVSINPAYPREALFRERVRAKHWQQHWPRLSIQRPSGNDRQLTVSR